LFISDQPITNSSQDIIGRKDFAFSLAETIDSYNSEDSLVLGLFGRWGSGKTSLINLVIEKLSQLGDNSNKPIIFKFNPWNFSEQNQLINQFFGTLSTLLKQRDNGDRLINVGEKLEEYSELFDPLMLVPGLNIPTIFAKYGTKIFGKYYKAKGHKNKKDLDTTRNNLNKLLKELKNKIIVVIDDIDRLTPSEIRQIFQLVKKIADFPNTIYLLSFDKQVVLNALSDVHKGFENEYLEKIVQVPFEIPQLSKEDLYKYLGKQLDRVLNDTPENRFDKNYWMNVFHSGIKFFFNSLRDVSRFINSLSFGYSLVKEAVNPVDFIAISTLQVFYSDLYYSIRANKGLFAGSRDTSSQRLFNEENKEKEYYNSIIVGTKLIPQENLQNLLVILFPKLDSIYSNSFYGSDWEGNWRKNCRVCSLEHFDTYFNLSIQRDRFTPNEMQIILSQSNKEAIFKDTLLKLNKEERITNFLDYLEDYTSDENVIPSSNIQNIVNVLMDIGDSFPEDENTTMYEFDTPMRLLRIFYQLSRRFQKHSERFELFKTAIEATENSIYTIVQEIGVQDQQHGKYSEEKAQPIDSLTVMEDQLLELEKLALSKIEYWAKHKELSNHLHFGAILYRWKEWSSLDRVKKYVNNLILTDEGLSNFIRAFLGRVVSYGSGDYGERVNWKINTKEIATFIDLSEIVPRIRALLDSDKIKKYSEKQVLALKTFIDTYDGKIKKDF
jgi:predicted KAP-like P-loop ATPase